MRVRTGRFAEVIDLIGQEGAEMTERCEQFAKNRGDFERNEHRNVFVILRYASEEPLLEVEVAIRDTLRHYGLNAVLARDVAFDEELWGNVRFCMDHSRYGIVVFERLIQPDHYPNITLELGYMLALRRQCLILKERSLPILNSDIVGRLYTPFDSHKATETVSSAVAAWLQRLGHTPGPSARTITGANHLEANKERTLRIIDALSDVEHIVRQAASLSSLAISDNEVNEEDHDGKYQEMLLRERHRLAHLLAQGRTVRVIICPDAQIERVELGLVSDEYVTRNILPRYDRLMKMIEEHADNDKLQVVFTLRLPHDNLLIVDDSVVFIGRKRRRDRGFPYTTQVFDPAVINDEITEFDAVFHDNVGALLSLQQFTETDYGSATLKSAVLEKLKTSKKRIQSIVKRNRSKA